MRCAVVIGLCVLMLVVISETKSFKQQTPSFDILKSRLLSQLKSRNNNLDKKGHDEEENYQGEAKPYSLIGLHATEYVAKCLANHTLMKMVDDTAWNTVDDAFPAFEQLYKDKDYFGCLWAGASLFSYENEPSKRPGIDSIFTVSKEVDRCNEMDGLKTKLLEIGDLPEYVAGLTAYMDSHCWIRNFEQAYGFPIGGLFTTATFDAISYAGICIVSNEPLYGCDYVKEAVKEYFHAFENIEDVFEEYTEEDIETYWYYYISFPEFYPDEVAVIDSLIESRTTLDKLESTFEQHGREYTCGYLKDFVEEANPWEDLTDKGSQMTGDMLNEIVKIVNRECDSQEDDKRVLPDEGNRKTAQIGQAADMGAIRSKLQPINSKRKMQVLKKIMKELLEKK